MQIKDVFGIFNSKPVKLILNKRDYATLIKIIKDSIKLCERNDTNHEVLVTNLEVIKNVLEKSICSDEFDLEQKTVVEIGNRQLHFGSEHLSNSVAKHALGGISNESPSVDDLCVQTNIVE